MQRFLPKPFRSKESSEYLSLKLLRTPSRLPGARGRKIYLNVSPSSNAPHEVFTDNKVKTSKYTMFTFLPKNLFEQFRRLANIYFLIIAILQLLPFYRVGTPILTLLPILFVISVTAIKDGFEDWKRHQVDYQYNRNKVWVLSNVENHNHSSNQKIRPIKRFKNFLFRRSSSDSTSSLDSPNHLDQTEFEPHHPRFTETVWQNVKVGDFVYLENNMSVPSDLLILTTSDDDGVCHVETKELDGETNLKPRVALTETRDFKGPQDCANLKAVIDSDAPTSNLYTYNGSMLIHPNTNEESSNLSSKAESSPIPISINNVLLRGHVLRNTNYVIGVVLFTGYETKIMLNSGKTPSKRSRIEVAMNKQVLGMFLVLILLGLTCGIGTGIYHRSWVNSGVDRVFDGTLSSPEFQGFFTFFASLILFQNVIPISLYVSIEFVKTFQAFFILNDIDMYYEPSNSTCIPKSWNLSDDLGQIEYVFSDKTGTLTRNIMDFRRCSINGRMYGQYLPGEESDAVKGQLVQNEEKVPLSNNQAKQNQTKEEMIEEYRSSLKDVFTPNYFDIEDPVTFIDAQLFKDLKGVALNENSFSKNSNHLSQGDHIRDFFMLMALCHTVLVERENDPKRRESLIRTSSSDWHSTRSFSKLIYKAESPDEGALVEAAKNLGFTFVGRQKEMIRVNILGKEIEFELLNVLEFNSTRKRMSVIIRRGPPWNDIILFCKGADNIVFDRLHPQHNSEELLSSTEQHLEAFSNEGLRVLVQAYKHISEEEYNSWSQRYNEAASSISEREEKLEAVFEEIEKDLLLLGATAIEDKLQEDVPQCIASLRAAGMKVWVLTGDKLQTAINIGFACSLLTKDMQLWTIKGDDRESVLSRFFFVAASVQNKPTTEDFSESVLSRSKSLRRSASLLRRHTSRNQVHALVMDGLALKIILANQEATSLLLEIAPLFRSVICCRVSPLQKAQVVYLIRKGHGAASLAIGDGANDVSMIQQADIGVAISGEEGLQAAMASDYTISRFKFLRNLLLVHGTWSYLRVAEMILCCFYKNIVFSIAGLWFQIFCGFTANIFYDYTFIQLFNLILTAIPVIILGASDKHISAKYALRYPGIYQVGIRGNRYSAWRFWMYCTEGVYQSLITFFSVYLLFLDDVVTLDGIAADQFRFSTIVAFCAVSLVNLFVGFCTYTWNWLTCTGIVVGMVFLFAFIPIYGMQSYDLRGVALVMYKQPSFWLILFFVIALSNLPRYIISYVKQMYYYEDIDIVREIEKFETDKEPVSAQSA